MSLKTVAKILYIIAFSVVVAGSVVYMSVRELGETSEYFQKLSMQKQAVQDLQLSLTEVLMPGNDYLITGNKEEKDNFNQLDKSLKDDFSKVKQVLPNESMQQLVIRIEEDYEEIKEIELAILGFQNPVGNRDGGKLMEQMDAFAVAMNKELQQLVTIVNNEEAVTLESLNKGQYRLSIIIIIATIICGALALAVSLTIKSKFINPLITLSNTADKIAAGDLTRYVDSNTKGEIGELINSFNKMVENLRSLIMGLLNAAKNVSITSSNLLVISNGAATSVQQVTNAIQQVAEGTLEQGRFIGTTMENVKKAHNSIKIISKGSEVQATNVTATSEMIGQMAVSIQDIASNAQNVSLSAERMRTAAKKGEEAVKHSINGMEGIKSKVFNSATKIKELGEHSAEIGEIVQVINSIAEQTNLLALNAAIEAARAGDHGKGFAVVAEEVRKLAERSSKATKEIEGLIANIQQLTTDAVSSMQEGTSEVARGTDLAAHAGGALAEILNNAEETYIQVQMISRLAEQISQNSHDVVKGVAEVSTITQQNAVSAQEITDVSKGIYGSMENISLVSQENSASAEEVSASSEETMASVEEIAIAAEQLSKMAGELEKMASRFKL